MVRRGPDLAGIGAAASGLATLVGAAAGFFGARSATGRHLRECEDRLGDLETTVGILLSLLPGGALADRFDMYRRDRDPEVVELLEESRVRWRARHGLDTQPL